MTFLTHASLLILGCTLVLPSTSLAAVCQSKECKEVAAEIVGNMNEDVDPCDDFYKYACGKSRRVKLMSLAKIAQVLTKRQADLLDDDNLRNHGSKAVRRAKKTYDDCLEQDDLTIHLMWKEQQKKKQQKSQTSHTFIPEGWLESMVNEPLDAKKAACRRNALTQCVHAFTRIYVDKYFPLAEHKASRNLISNVRSAFINNIVDKITWIDPATKKRTLYNLTNLELNTGYPDWITDDKELDDECISEIPHPTWPMFPLTVNAHYALSRINQGRFEITIPAGILLGSVFNRKIPNYINYGGAGFVAGHEISHGVYQWTQETTPSTGRDKGLQCLVDQLETIVDPTTGRAYDDGLRAINEMNSDVTGINASLTAYRKLGQKDQQLPGLTHLSNEQLFFLSEANTWCSNTNINLAPQWPPFSEHPAPYYRVVIPAMNSHDFARAFKCPAGSFMNPVKKCVLW